MATLLNVLGIARWGSNETGRIEATWHKNKVLIQYTGHPPYQVLWDTELEGRYPGTSEFEKIQQMLDI